MARQPATDSQTLADVVHGLGDVPLYRVCAKPPPGTAREADVLAARRTPERWLCELADGVLIRKASHFRAAVVSAALLYHLHEIREIKRSGVLLPGNMPFQLARDLVRIPDVSFIPWERFPGRKLHDEEIGTTMPTLVVEVVSVSDGEREIERKRQEYFRASVEEVWIIDCGQRHAAIWYSPTSVREIPSRGTLGESRLFPDFRLPLDDLFACLIRPEERASR